MSRSVGPEIHFKCSSDCREGGCPGHSMREVFDRTSDVYTFEIDGKAAYYFDENSLKALLQAHNVARET